jgi:hypothetical protein
MNLSGTSDEHISLLESLSPLLLSPTSTFSTTATTTTASLPTLHSILVTTPQAISLLDVSKELNFSRRVNLPVIGLIENMSGYVCPCCGEISNVFGTGGGEKFCELETERWKMGKLEEGELGGELRYLGKVPIERELVKLLDGSQNQQAESQGRTNGVDGNQDSKFHQVKTSLLERYQQTKTWPIFREIAKKIAEAVEGNNVEERL